MNRALLRRLVYAVIAVQLLLSAPLASAAAENAGRTVASASLVVSEHSHGGEQDPCPCCPDGETGLAACLSACAATVAVLPSISFSMATPVTVPAVAATPVIYSPPTSPPLKPPPIC